MPELKDLLERFRKILSSKEGDVNLVLEAILKQTNIKLDKEEVELKGRIVYLNTKPIYKNEISIKKEKILQSIKDETGKVFENIR